MNKSIDILLSTYNGEKYLEQQIDSILNQKYDNWRLIIRDDGSNDNTRNIIESYNRLNPDRLYVINDKHGNLGPAQSFHILAQHSSAPYVAFCDQDDIWLPEKLSSQISVIHEQETTYGEKYPLLIHSDLLVVDEDLSAISDSYWFSRSVWPEDMNNLTRLLTKNYVTGCTVLVNRCLIDLAMPFPEKIIMHDWWLALLAVSNGRIIDMQEKTVKYRQHASNVIGGKASLFARFTKASYTGGIYLKEYLVITRRQAEALLEADKVTGENKVIVEEFVRMFKLGWFERRFISLRNKYFRYGFIRNVLLFIYM